MQPQISINFSLLRLFKMCYGEHVNVDSSSEYAHAVYERLAADEDVYSVELCARNIQVKSRGGPAPSPTLSDWR